MPASRAPVRPNAKWKPEWARCLIEETHATRVRIFNKHTMADIRVPCFCNTCSIAFTHVWGFQNSANPTCGKMSLGNYKPACSMLPYFSTFIAMALA